MLLRAAAAAAAPAARSGRRGPNEARHPEARCPRPHVLGHLAGGAGWVAVRRAQRAAVVRPSCGANMVAWDAPPAGSGVRDAGVAGAAAATTAAARAVAGASLPPAYVLTAGGRAAAPAAAIQAPYRHSCTSIYLVPVASASVPVVAVVTPLKWQK